MPLKFLKIENTTIGLNVCPKLGLETPFYEAMVFGIREKHDHTINGDYVTKKTTMYHQKHICNKVDCEKSLLLDNINFDTYFFNSRINFRLSLCSDHMLSIQNSYLIMSV